jgi:CBS-domain-containing membrane protein
MTHDPVTVQEEASLNELVRLMEKHHVHRLPVMRDKTLTGIVTRSNLLPAVAAMAGEVPSPPSTTTRFANTS